MAREGKELSQLRRWHTDAVVFSWLRRQSMHGYGLFQMFQEAGGPEFQVPLVTLYALLRRFERQGWIRGHWEAGVSRGHQLVYSLTEKGQKELTRRTVRWKRFHARVNHLLELSPVCRSSGRMLGKKLLRAGPRKKSARKREVEDLSAAVLKGMVRRHIPLRKIFRAPPSLIP